MNEGAEHVDSAAASQTVAAAGTKAGVSWWAIGLMIATIGPFSLNSGFIFPANAFLLDARGYSAAVVGAVGSAGAIGYIAGSLLAPFAAAAFGLRRTAIVAILATAGTVFAFAIVPPVLVWYPMRLFHGVATTILFVCGESALIAVAPTQMRGRIIGFYTAVNSIFFSAGPVVISVLGFDGLLPYLLVSAVICLLALPMAALGESTPRLPPIGWRRLVASVGTIPVLLIVIGAWGWIDGATLNLWGIYAVKRGATAARASYLLSLMALGNVFLQFPVGWLADHLPRRRVLIGLSAAGCAGSLLLLPCDIAGLPMIVNLVVLGAVGFGTFTVALIALGDALSGTALLAANAVFGLCYGVGDFAGASVTGALMNALGTDAFPLALASGFLLQCAAIVVLPLRVEHAAGQT